MSYMPYLITRNPSRIQSPAIVLGSMPGWEPGPSDRHFTCSEDEILIDYLPLPCEEDETLYSEIWEQVTWGLENPKKISLPIVARDLTLNNVLAAAWMEMRRSQIENIRGEFRCIALSEKSIFHPELAQNQALFGYRVLTGFRDIIYDELFCLYSSKEEYDSERFQSELFSTMVNRATMAVDEIRIWPGI